MEINKDELKQNLDSVRERVIRAAQKSGRKPETRLSSSR